MVKTLTFERAKGMSVKGVAARKRKKAERLAAAAAMAAARTVENVTVSVIPTAQTLLSRLEWVMEHLHQTGPLEAPDRICKNLLMEARQDASKFYGDFLPLMVRSEKGRGEVEKVADVGQEAALEAAAGYLAGVGGCVCQACGGKGFVVPQVAQAVASGDANASPGKQGAI